MGSGKASLCNYTGNLLLPQQSSKPWLLPDFAVEDTCHALYFMMTQKIPKLSDTVGQVSKTFYPSCKMDLKLSPQCLRSFQISWEYEEQYNRLFCSFSDSYILIAQYYLLHALISVFCLASTIICFQKLDSCQTFCCNLYGMWL